MKLINETIGSYTKKIFNKYANEEALVYVEDGRRYTYKELNKQVDIIAKAFISMGVKKDDHIALLSSNSPEWIIVFLATLKIGVVCVCINYLSTEEEIDYMLKKSESTILIVSDKEMIEKVDVDKFTYLKVTIKMKNLFNLGNLMEKMSRISDEELKQVADSVTPEDIATILYSSGTTGNPKGILYTHKAILNGPLSFLENYKYTSKDRILASLPLNHILGGKYTAFLGLFAGSTIFLMEKFKTGLALQTIEKEKCTGFHGVPTMYRYLLNKSEGYDLSSLRVGMIAGAVTSPTLMKEVMEKLHILELNNTFGQTETLGVTQTTVFDKDDPKINTVGKPVEHVQIKICDYDTLEEVPINTPGELLVKSPYSMIEYYKDPEATKKTIVDGWIRTGDFAIIDEDGYLSIKGRIKDVIIRGGENLSPTDIENCITKHPKVANAIVVGVPDNTMGEEVFAFVKINENESLSEEDILEFLSGKIAKYKFPKYFDFVKEFPLTSTGKIKRNILKDMASEKINKKTLEEVAIG